MKTGLSEKMKYENFLIDITLYFKKVTNMVGMLWSISSEKCWSIEYLFHFVICVQASLVVTINFYILRYNFCYFASLSLCLSFRLVLLTDFAF